VDRFRSIDDKIQAGYAGVLENDYPGGCDKWLEAWDEIKALLNEGVVEDIDELDREYKWTQYISNYVQDVEAELHNAGIDDKIYHQKRVVFCQELIQWCKDGLIANNARIGMAEAYYEIGDPASGDRVFDDWLRDDPDCGMGYCGWAECYQYDLFAGENRERAEEILLAGYARSNLREKSEVVERLISLYEDMGKPDKVKEYKRVYSELNRAKAIKIGRNDPCPCGSGKKYKKCCGA